jgi:hypothetical protein
MPSSCRSGQLGVYFKMLLCTSQKDWNRNRSRIFFFFPELDFEHSIRLVRLRNTAEH